MVDIPPLRVGDFFRYARERELVRLRRETGQPAPWTDDPILQEYRFCNVFREHDRTTTWFRERIREPLNQHLDPELMLLGIVAFRWFNRIETWDTLLNSCGCSLVDLLTTWEPSHIEHLLRTHGSPPWTNGAYIIKTPDGMDKLDGVLWCIQRFVEAEYKLVKRIFLSNSLETSTKMLTEFPYMGPFMAYEVVTDLRHTWLLEGAEDIMTWANPGPGAARGASRVLGREPGYLSRGNIKDVLMLQGVMKILLHEAHKESQWSSNWPRWEMRDVEHTLCEFDKYERARLGEGRPKQRFRGGR